MSVRPVYRPYLYLFFPFLVMEVVNLFLPVRPLLDERLFFPTVQDFGAHYLPTLEQLRTMNSPMGPVYFVFWGFVGKLCGFSLPVMRAIQILLSYGLVVVLYRLLRGWVEYPLLLTGLFILNPYFWIMTAPLLYTDVPALIFSFLGAYYYLNREDRLAAGWWWGLAICTRQLMVFFPLAAGLVDLFLVVRGRLAFRKLGYDFLPLVLFLPFFYLWGWNVNSGAFTGQQFEENTLEAFAFSFKAFNYSLLHYGIYALPVWLFRKRARLSRRSLLWFLPAAGLMFLEMPVKVNAGLSYGRLPDTAGLLDIALVQLGPFAYPVVLLGLAFALLVGRAMLRGPVMRRTLFYQTLLVLFLLLESFYSYCWDKHFLPVIPFVFLLAWERLGEAR